MRTCQVDIGFGKWCFLLHVRISVWIDLGGGLLVIDLPRSWDSVPQRMFVWIWQLSHWINENPTV